MGAKSPHVNAGGLSNTFNHGDTSTSRRSGILDVPGSTLTNNNDSQSQGPLTQFLNMNWNTPSSLFDTPTQHHVPQTPTAPVKHYKFGQIFDVNGHPMPPLDYASRSFDFTGTPEGNPTPRFTLRINSNASPSSSQDLPYNPSPLAEMLREHYRAQHMPQYLSTVAAGRAQPVKEEEGISGTGKENMGTLAVTTKASRVDWNASLYLKAARIVNVQQPWLAPHGKKAGAWDECACEGYIYQNAYYSKQTLILLYLRLDYTLVTKCHIEYNLLLT
ncbi:hypothetical protein C8F01DRAFT_1236830, partial [Mycena amicta]